jgi:hypothetical protein
MNTVHDHKPLAEAIQLQNRIAADIGKHGAEIVRLNALIEARAHRQGANSALELYEAGEASGDAELDEARKALQAARAKQSLAQQASHDAAMRVRDCRREAGALAVKERASEVAQLQSKMLNAAAALADAHNAFAEWCASLERQGFDIDAFRSTADFVPTAPGMGRDDFRAWLNEWLAKRQPATPKRAAR